MYSTRAIVSTTPETIMFLREQLTKPPRTVHADSEKVSTGTGFGPRAPLNLDALEAADRELESLAYWAGELGCALTGLGPVWRVQGEIRGVLYDSPLPAERLTERVLDAMDTPGYVEPHGMTRLMGELRADHCRRFPQLQDLLAHNEETSGDAYAFI